MLLVVVGLPVIAPAPASAASEVTITASRTSYTSVVIRRNATLDLDRARVTGGGELAGFVLQPADGGPSTAVLVMRTPGWTPHVTNGGQLRPGTYRLHVAATSPVRITVPASGLARTAWRASAPLPLKRVSPTWPVAAGPVIAASTSIQLTTRSVALFYLGYHETAQGGEVAMCVTAPSGSCGNGEDRWLFTKTSERLGVAVNERQGLAVLADRADLAAGTFAAGWRIVARGTATEPTAVAFVLG